MNRRESLRCATPHLVDRLPGRARMELIGDHGSEAMGPAVYADGEEVKAGLALVFATKTATRCYVDAVVLRLKHAHLPVLVIMFMMRLYGMKRSVL